LSLLIDLSLQAASVLSHQEGDFGAVFSTRNALDDRGERREGELGDAPPTWALYPHGEEAAGGDGEVHEHYMSDTSPRDAYRRQLAHMVETTDPGTTFQLPSDVIDDQLGKGALKEMRDGDPVAGTGGAALPAPANAPSLLFMASGAQGAAGVATTQELADLPAMMRRGGAAGAEGAGGGVPGA